MENATESAINQSLISVDDLDRLEEEFLQSFRNKSDVEFAKLALEYLDNCRKYRCAGLSLPDALITIIKYINLIIAEIIDKDGKFVDIDKQISDLDPKDPNEQSWKLLDNKTKFLRAVSFTCQQIRTLELNRINNISSAAYLAAIKKSSTNTGK